LSSRSPGEAVEAYIPISLVKEYYWCPMYAYLSLTAWRERPTESMKAGAEVPRGRLAELLEQRHRLRELLWEHPVASHRLRVAGRADLVAVTTGDTLVVAEAKLSPASRRGLKTRDRRLAVQLAAYAIAAEETLRMPLEAAYIYSTEADRLIPVPVTPSLRRLAAYAAERLHEMLATGNPPPPGEAERRRCSACSYRSVCPYSRG
jgi:CRISPR-associated exonuclease Cas4